MGVTDVQNRVPRRAVLTAGLGLAASSLPTDAKRKHHKRRNHANPAT